MKWIRILERFLEVQTVCVYLTCRGAPRLDWVKWDPEIRRHASSAKRVEMCRSSQVI